MRFIESLRSTSSPEAQAKLAETDLLRSLSQYNAAKEQVDDYVRPYLAIKFIQDGLISTPVARYKRPRFTHQYEAHLLNQDVIDVLSDAYDKYVNVQEAAGKVLRNVLTPKEHIFLEQIHERVEKFNSGYSVPVQSEIIIVGGVARRCFDSSVEPKDLDVRIVNSLNPLSDNAEAYFTSASEMLKDYLESQTSGRGLIKEVKVPYHSSLAMTKGIKTQEEYDDVVRRMDQLVLRSSMRNPSDSPRRVDVLLSGPCQMNISEYSSPTNWDTDFPHIVYTPY